MITTILPTFQRPQLLKRAIQSVLSQTFSDFILHIHDNASQDETEKVVSQFQDPRIKYFKGETNIGLVQNFAHAIDQVTTPYFSFLSDDDFLLPKFYVTTLEGFEKYPTAGFSAGRTLKCNSKGKYPKDQYIHPFLDGYFLAGDALIALAETKNFPIWTGILFKTELVKQLGGLATQAGHAIDMELTLRVASCTSIVVTPTPVAVLMVWKESASKVLISMKETNFDPLVDNVLPHFVGSAAKKEIAKRNLQQMRIGGYRHIWIHSLLANQIENAQAAREVFLQLGGYTHPLKLKLLKLAESNACVRKIFLIYFHSRIMLRRYGS